jgi:hypothetical protein
MLVIASKRDQLPHSLCWERLAARQLTGWTARDCLIVALLFVNRCRSEQEREDFDYGEQ